MPERCSTCVSDRAGAQDHFPFAGLDNFRRLERNAPDGGPCSTSGGHQQFLFSMQVGSSTRLEETSRDDSAVRASVLHEIATLLSGVKSGFFRIPFSPRIADASDPRNTAALHPSRPVP